MNGASEGAPGAAGGGPDWSTSVRGIDLARVRRLRRRGFRDTVQAIGRQERQRVVPLPLAVGAVLLPFLAAWAAAAPPGGERARSAAPAAPAAPAAEAVPARPRPPAALARERRVPADPDGYVDVWGPVEPWERRLLDR